MKRAAELLMPAGSLEKLKVAILYGADAVYMGTPDLSLRTRSNFSLDDVLEGVAFAHAHGKRAYLTLNLFSHNRDIEKLPEYVQTIRKVRPDGVIVADPGVFNFVKRAAPELELHISTQANVCSWLSVQFWEGLGASLIVLAREVSFEELEEIRERCPRHQARSLHSRRDVHDLFGALPPLELSDGARREPGQLHELVPLELQSQGAVERRIAKRPRAE